MTESLPRRQPDQAGAAQQETHRARHRHRGSTRDVFGDVLPDTTEDERDRGWNGDGAEGERDEAWYRAQRPPHHDRSRI